ncbi:MAG TPA: class I SAM-dependent methyltransferase [Terracidiphilus sp.]
MAHRVCPWWIGYFLASPIRRWLSEKPEILLAPWVKSGMTIVEPGPGMGFFTLPMARMAGPSGRVIAVDIQPKMLASLNRRARKAGLEGRIETRLVQPGSMGLDDLRGAADFALVFAVVHEVPSAAGFFAEIASALKRGGLLLFAEPAGHVSPEDFESEIKAAQLAGLAEISRPSVRRSHAGLLKKV